MLIRHHTTNEVLHEVPDVPTVGEAVWKLADQAHERGVMVNLEGADLSRADICCVNLSAANLECTNLEGANLKGAELDYASLIGASLIGANLSGANLSNASLRGANLEGADLEATQLEGADLEGAIMPDGRPFYIYKRDPLAGICDDPEARKRAIGAWGNHSWENCPMHAAHGWLGLGDAPDDKQIKVAAFVALFDSSKLPKPT